MKNFFSKIKKYVMLALSVVFIGTGVMIFGVGICIILIGEWIMNTASAMRKNGN